MVQEFVKDLVGDDSLTGALQRFGREQAVEDPASSREAVAERSRKSPLLSMITVLRVGDGNTVTKIPSGSPMRADHDLGQYDAESIQMFAHMCGKPVLDALQQQYQPTLEADDSALRADRHPRTSRPSDRIVLPALDEEGLRQRSLGDRARVGACGAQRLQRCRDHHDRDEGTPRRGGIHWRRSCTRAVARRSGCSALPGSCQIPSGCSRGQALVESAKQSHSRAAGRVGRSAVHRSFSSGLLARRYLRGTPVRLGRAHLRERCAPGKIIYLGLRPLGVHARDSTIPTTRYPVHTTACAIPGEVQTDNEIGDA